MASKEKLDKIKDLERETADIITQSPEGWTDYLDTAANLYRYPFEDTLLIHAQRPTATFCADMATWNNRMNRWVNAGSKGIALFDNSNSNEPRKKLYYVFDLADTHSGYGNAVYTPTYWTVGLEQRNDLRLHLIDAYGLDDDNADTLANTLREVVLTQTEENIEDIYSEFDRSLEVDSDAQINKDEFRNLAQNSAYYMLLYRCGINPMNYLKPDDFNDITLLNNELYALACLGNSTHEITEPVLKDIYRAVKNISRETVEKQVTASLEADNNNDNVIKAKHENANAIENNDQKEKGGKENETGVHEERGLSVSESNSGQGRERGTDREVRKDEVVFSEGSQEMDVRRNAVRGHSDGSREGDRQRSKREDGSSDERTPEEISGTGQSNGSDGMGSSHEQSDSDGRGKRLNGIGIQLIEDNQGNNDLEEGISSELSLPDLPSEEEQRRNLAEPVRAAFINEGSPVSADIVDEILRSGGTHDNSQLRIIYNYMVEKSPEEYRDFIRNEYGTGGKGFIIDEQQYAVWFDKYGFIIAKGTEAQGERNLENQLCLSWQQVSDRIGELLDQGEYASQNILDQAREYSLHDHAEKLSFFERDMADGVAEAVFADVSVFRGVYPDITDRLADLINDPEFLGDLNLRLSAFADQYKEHHELMRSHSYNPEKVAAEFKSFAKEAIPFKAREGFEYTEPERFITQDEIDKFLCKGGGTMDGDFRIYSYFLQDHTAKEKQEFLKNEYGTGGSYNDEYNCEWSAKGIQISAGKILDIKASINISWANAAKRTEYLVQNHWFLDEDKEFKTGEYELKEMAQSVWSFYSGLSVDIERPFNSDDNYFFTDKLAKEISDKLLDDDQSLELLSQMSIALSKLPLDYKEYDRLAQILENLTLYEKGEYTLFPEKKSEPEEKTEPENKDEDGQLSLFDFMDLSNEKESGNEGLNNSEDLSGILEEAGESEIVHTDDGAYIPLENSKKEISKDPIEKAKALIAEFCDSEYGQDSDVDFSDPEHIGIAYTTLGDAEFPIQVCVNLNDFTIEKYLNFLGADDGEEYEKTADFDGETYHLAEVIEYGSIEKLNDALIEADFNDLILLPDIVDEQIEKYSELYLQSSVETQQDQPKNNFHITNDDLGAGGAKTKFRANMDAIYLLKTIESENRLATPEEQEVLSQYVGWGGIPQAFDANNVSWVSEYAEIKSVLTDEEYKEARSSTLSAFYTPPIVIRAMYETLENMGLKSGNVLEPACGIGNFIGMLPESMSDVKMYGVELDSISGRIAKQLYQKNSIAVQGFEKTNFPDSFFDCAIGNVPFGNYKVNDPKYDKYNFMIHDYFIARSIDLVRPGGVVAFITSSGTMDKQDDSVRQYIADRADLLGAVRMPNNAFMRNANTGVVADILFLQKRDRASLEKPSWVNLGVTEEGYTINQYFVEHPEMVLGNLGLEHTQYGREEVTVNPINGADLAEQLSSAMSNIHGTIPEIDIDESEIDGLDTSIPADPAIDNFSYTNIDGKIYYRQDSRMILSDMPKTTEERVRGMIELKDTVHELLNMQLNDASDEEITALQNKLNEQYDEFTNKYGLISSNANRRAFDQDSSYCLLSSLEVLDENGELERKADIFTQRTIRKAQPVTSVDTASEALALSIGEKAKVDLPYMSALTGKSEDDITKELTGVIFKNPLTDQWENADEYLSGNVREKLKVARISAESNPEFNINVQCLEKVQPKDLDASEIEVRLGATWIDPKYINQFMYEVFHTPSYMIGYKINTLYSPVTGQWQINGKGNDNYNSITYSTYGTTRVSAYKLLEDALNLRDTKIYDNYEDSEGKHHVLNRRETTLAQQKQEMIKDAFKDWIFQDMDRREELCKKYNETFNSIRPREYDGSHIRFVGMNPEIDLMPHQKNAVAHVLYGNNTLLAHCVGAGKTFEMVAAGMESQRLGLSHKCLYVVPNHLTEQWGSEFLRLYPAANILVATKKDFEPANRKKFCSRIATGNYDAIIIGHSQFERIPLSVERQIYYVEKQIDDITNAIEEAKDQRGDRFSIKQMERTKKSLETRLDKLNDQSDKDNVVTFEQLGIDRLFVDESHNYKNLFLYTKMRNIAGVSQTDAKKSSDMFMKCQYMDELTGGRGVTFATGTPVSNSMVELYTIMRYLQYNTLQEMGFGNFDAWASTFGETVTAIELSPEGTGYRAKTRFAKFYNLPELISMFKETADIQTADMLNLPVPEAEQINVVLKPSETQKELVSSFADRAEAVRNGDIEPKVDNMLNITNDGRKCALDQRLIDDMLPDEPESKVNKCVDNIYSIWKNTTGDRSTQLVFCDMSTPKNNGKFNVYDDVKNKLINKGIPENEIAFIHDADTEVKKANLFEKMRKGQVRVLLGSTAKLGTGTNIQDRMIALHHLDVPWKPSDLEQREGRILRQGNHNSKVQIYRYVTEGTFDAYMWQILENKQKFISQIMTSKSPVRSADDVDEASLSYAEIKALATGNPYIKEKMDLDVQVSKLKMLKSNHTSQIYRLQSDIAKKYPAEIESTKERINGLKADLVTAQKILTEDKDEFSMKIGSKTYTDKKEAGAALIASCKDLVGRRTFGKIGEYQGFTLNSSYEYLKQKYIITIKGNCSYSIEMGKDEIGNIQRIHNALKEIEPEITAAEQKLDKLQEQFETAKEEVKKPFAQEEELETKSARLAELNSILNMDEKDASDSIGIDEECDSDDQKETCAESCDRPSVLEKLKEKQKQIQFQPSSQPNRKLQEQAI